MSRYQFYFIDQHKKSIMSNLKLNFLQVVVIFVSKFETFISEFQSYSENVHNCQMLLKELQNGMFPFYCCQELSILMQTNFSSRAE